MGDQHSTDTQQNTVMATYRLKAGAEPAFVEILKKHHATLVHLGLAEDAPAQIFRQQTAEGLVSFVEIFTWKPGAARKAHEHPEVAMTWEGMTPLLEAHGDRRAMEFPHFARWTP